MLMSRVLVELEKIDSTTESAQKGLRSIFRTISIYAVFKLCKDITNKDLNSCDIYFAVRPCSPRSLSIAKAIKKSGKIYIAYFDDDLLHLPGMLSWKRNNIQNCLKVADVVVGANPNLVEEYRELSVSHRAAVINTPILKNDLLMPRKIQNIVNFVYAAGRDHELCFERLLLQPLKEFMKDYHDKVHFTFIGVEPNVSAVGYSECFTFVGLMPLDEYNEYMMSHRFDIGLAPLDDNSFNNHKYFNKYIEYSKLGILGLYSNCKPYTFVVQNDENGYLIDNTPDSWLKIMKDLMNSYDSIYRNVCRAQKNLSDNFSLEYVADSLLAQIPEFCEFKNEESVDWRASRATDLRFELYDKCKKMSEQYKTRGTKGMLKLVKNHLKDKKKRS